MDGILSPVRSEAVAAMTGFTICPTGKTPYETRAKAKKMRARANFRRARLHIYRCDLCGYFHMGHRPKYFDQN